MRYVEFIALGRVTFDGLYLVSTYFSEVYLDIK